MLLCQNRMAATVYGCIGHVLVVELITGWGWSCPKMRPGYVTDTHPPDCLLRLTEIVKWDGYIVGGIGRVELENHELSGMYAQFTARSGPDFDFVNNVLHSFFIWFSKSPPLPTEARTKLVETYAPFVNMDICGWAGAISCSSKTHG